MANITTITSAIVETKLGVEIKKKDLALYILYRILIETGIPYTHLVKRNVGSFRNKKNISYSTKNEGIITESFSDDTLENISIYIEEKDDDELMFPNKHTDSPLHPSCAIRAFNRCAKKIGLSERITPAVLKKTYFFHLLLNTSEMSVFRKRTSLYTKKEICDYFGIETIPQIIVTWERSNFQQFYETTDFASIKNKLENVLSVIDKISKEDGDLPEIFYKESVLTITSIDNLLNEYANFIEKSGYN